MSFKNELLVQEYEYDFARDGGATGVYRLDTLANKKALPVGAVLKEANVVVQTALQGSGASAKLGSVASDALYKANAAVASWGLGLTSYSTPTLVDAANKGQVAFTVAGGALTAGKLKVLLEYVVPNT